MQFDARTAKLLEPGAHLTFDGYPGLRLEATLQYRTWVYRYKSPSGGQMRQSKLGRWPAMSWPAAVVAWEAARAQRAAGVDLSEAKRAERVASAEKAAARRRQVLSVEDACAAYIAGHVVQRRTAKGAAEVTRTFRTMLGDMSSKPVADVTRADAFNLIQSHAQVPVQAAKLRAELGAAWDYCLDAGMIPDSTPNWWRQILRGKLRSTGFVVQGERRGVQKRVLQPAEVSELLAFMPAYTQLNRDILTLYLWTAARGGEIVAMAGREVAEEAGQLWWTIPKAKTKNRHRAGATDHRVPLFGRAEEVVRRRIAQYGQGALFPSDAGPGHVQQKVVGVAVHYHRADSQVYPERQRPRCPVAHWAPHDLRRTARTFLAALGCPREVAEAIIGHMPPGIVGVYERHTYDAERATWLMRLSDYLEGLARPHR